MSLISESKKNNKANLVGVCLPFEKNHIEFINNIKYSLDKLDIIVIWVKENDVVIENKNEEFDELIFR